MSSVTKVEDEQQESQRSSKIKWRVRPMQLDDIDKCLVIWRQVELTEAHQTVASALVTDPDGFYVAELYGNDDDDGQVIGMCSGTLARPGTAFMGFYAVEPQFQGLGVGRELWSRTTERLAGVNVGLYGVPMMSEKYKKSGFKIEDSIRMLIFESEPGQVMHLEALKSLNDLHCQDDTYLDLITLELDCDLVNCKLLVDKLIDYDATVNKCKRELLLRNYLTPGKVHNAGAPLTVALVKRQSSQQPHDDQDENFIDERRVQESLKISATSATCHQQQQTQVEQVLGYGCIRADNTDGAIIGPIYANSADYCEVVLRCLMEKFSLPMGGKYSAMSLTSNSQASELLQRVGLRELDQCSRMFTKFVPDAQADKIFYVHSPNFTLF